jgi:FixJ family two-component response regulator
MSGSKPTVFVVDDDPSVRRAIERVLRSAGLTVSTYVSAQEYLVLDLAMPGMTGLELQDALTRTGEALPIIFLTGNAGIPDSVHAMKHGAVDFLTKPVDDRELIDAIRNAFEKDRIDRVLRAELAEIRQRLASLTPRELEVLGYVVLGKLNKQIAAELGTVEKTIKVHRARVMDKMRVRSLAELVRLAARVGINPPA